MNKSVVFGNTIGFGLFCTRASSEKFDSSLKECGWSDGPIRISALSSLEGNRRDVGQTVFVGHAPSSRATSGRICWGDGECLVFCCRFSLDGGRQAAINKIATQASNVCILFSAPLSDPFSQPGRVN